MAYPTPATSALRRRDILRLGGLTVTGVATASACDYLSTEPTSSGRDKPDKTTDPGVSKEVPSLKHKVDAGKLPPAEKRLPDKPMVVRPIDRRGVHGGQWHAAVKSGSSIQLYMMIGYEQLVSWTPSFNGDVVPNIAQSVEMSDDGTRYTIRLRPGMRWSDGHPYTADDLLFDYQDILQNEELYPAGPPSFLAPEGKAAKLEKVDHHTVRLTFSEPNGLFLQRLAGPDGRKFTGQPRHYLKEYHEDHNPDIEKLVKDEGFDDWTELLFAKRDEWTNPDRPTLHAWHCTTVFTEGKRFPAERNPYYFKTDPAGQPLPYLDRVTFDVAGSAEVILLKAAHGDIDMDVLAVNNLRSKPVLARSRKKSNYHFLSIAPTSMNYLIISFNLTHKDPKLREVFRNKDFRVGLSHAIDRQEIIDVHFQKQGHPWQAAPRPDSPFADKKLASQYLEYDVDKANQLLDKAGYGRRDSHGFRLRPDGKRIRFTTEVALGADFELTEPMELVRKYWRKVGIDMRVKSENRSLFYERKTANLHDANVWFDKMGLQDAILDPRWYLPISGESNYAIPWANWYNGAEPKERPPEATRRQMGLYDQLIRSPEKPRREKLFAEILEIARDEFYVIGTVMPAQGFGIVKNNFRNVIDPMTGGWIYPTPGPSRPEQYFMDES